MTADESASSTVRRDPMGSFRRSFVTAESVYGTILVSGLILALSLGDTTDDETFTVDDGASLHIFWVTLITVIVFWAAHVYAATVAFHGRDGDAVVTVSGALKRALRHSSGLLLAAVVPLLAVLLGVFDVVDDESAVDIALWSAVVVLGVLGYIAFHERRSSMLVRIFGALGTALFGVVIIFVNAIVH